MKIKVKISALSALVLLAGCLKEDRSECPQGKYIWFKSINEKYNYTDIVENLTLYVYDNNENLVATHNYASERLQDWDFNAYLPPPTPTLGSTYTVVALMNLTDDYEVTGEEVLSDFLLSLAIVENDTVQGKPADIYHAQQQVTFDATGVTRDTMNLSKNTNYINLTLELIDFPQPEGTSVQPFISGTNRSYNYLNKPVGGQKLVYLASPLTLSTAITVHAFKILRIWIGDDLTLRVEQHEAGTVPVILKEIMLTEEIAKVKDDNGNFLYDTDEKLEQEDVFNIKISLQGASLSVIGITINDWSVISPGVGI